MKNITKQELTDYVKLGFFVKKKNETKKLIGIN